MTFIGRPVTSGSALSWSGTSLVFDTTIPSGGGSSSFAINSQLAVSNGSSSPVDAGAFYIPSTTTFTTIEAGIMSAGFGNPRIRIINAATDATIYDWYFNTFNGPGWRVSNLATAPLGAVSPPYVFSTGWYRVRFDNATGNGNVQVLMNLRMV